MDFSPGRAYGIRLKNKLFSDSPGADLHGWSIATKRLADVAEDEGDIEEIAGEENDAPDPKKLRRGFWKSEKFWEGTGPLPGVINEVVRRHTAQKQAPPPVRKSKRPHQSGNIPLRSREGLVRGSPTFADIRRQKTSTVCSLEATCRQWHR